VRSSARLAEIFLAVVLAACTSSGATSPVTLPPSIATSPSPAETATSKPIDIVGTWHRAQTCEEMRVAFETAGLAESHRAWITSSDVCQGARGPLEHSHFFTATGGFGSHDENGDQVDDGDYEAIDADTLAFPSHATEFSFDGDLVVDYVIDGDVVTFDVALPNPCEQTCRDAYAWAHSAFSSGPWMRGDIP
jgi:hypothetical protein